MAQQQWQCIVGGDFLSIGVRCDETAVFEVGYLPATHPPLAAQNRLARECAKQIAAYFRQPRRHTFDLPLYPPKTDFQKRVRAVVRGIPTGQVLTYGEVSRRLRNTSPRAVGGACRANPTPLVVPCHRVVAHNGLGGFMGGDPTPHNRSLTIKKRLLQHEGAAV